MPLFSIILFWRGSISDLTIPEVRQALSIPSIRKSLVWIVCLTGNCNKFHDQVITFQLMSPDKSKSEHLTIRLPIQQLSKQPHKWKGLAQEKMQTGFLGQKMCQMISVVFCVLFRRLHTSELPDFEVMPFLPRSYATFPLKLCHFCPEAMSFPPN